MNEERPSKTAMDIPNPYHASTMDITTNSTFVRSPSSTQRAKSARPAITLSPSSLCSPPLSSPSKTTAIPSSSNNTDTKKQQHISSTESPQQKDQPERRTVRRTSLLLKSKALSRVMHQAEEEIHLADLEMRQEHGTTLHLKSRLAATTSGHGTEAHPPPPPPLPSPFPFPPWTSSATNSISSNIHASSTPPIPIDMSSSSSSSSLSSSPMAYQCSKLNPELEMTNFQFENLPSPMQSSFKSIKRKGKYS
ncbi:hypothetical protein BCR42DRAFT_20516 [Absidia repens]|uniref:Uncharacterized protein n=1 Tax=Absidia repens TaxID=90262 RepID=A0A1X2J2X7_9FUNG|nr:hypothetical protein BCR42DRAFT_20516 [Absidia repens]